MRNWLKKCNRRIWDLIKLRKIYKRLAYEIRDLWYCPQCKTENSIRLSRMENYIRIHCYTPSTYSCDFRYKVDLNDPEKLKHEYLENKFYSLEDLNRLQEDTFNPDVIKTKSKDGYNDFIVYPNEKILEGCECWYYDESNSNEHAKEGSVLLTTKRLILSSDEKEDKRGNKIDVLKKAEEILRRVGSFIENKILLSLFVVIAGLFGLKEVNMNNFQRMLSERIGINFNTIGIWMNRIQNLVFENSTETILFLDFYIFWLVFASLIWGHKDLNLAKRILSFVKYLPHFLYFIFVIIIFQIATVKSLWDLIISPPLLFVTFILLWELLRYLVFQIEWHILKLKPEIPFDHKKFKEINLRYFRFVNFHPVSMGPVIDKPAQKRPSIEIYYQDGKIISRIILRLIIANHALGKDLFEKIEYRLMNYHAMKSFVEKAKYYAIKENC